MTEKITSLIDLHLHLDGSLSLGTVKALAEMQNIEIPETDEEILNTLRVSKDCRNLNEYLEKFAFPCRLLQTKEAISEAVFRLCEELRRDGLIYAEIRFAPQLHLDGGLTQNQVVAAAIDGAERSSLRCGLILCCMRGSDNHDRNIDTVLAADKYLGSVVRAVDLAGAEAPFPTRDFEDVFALAREKNIPFTIHAGEADGPESVRDALRFGAKRIGHGVRSTEDEGLLKELADSEVTLELCPTSNLHTCIYSAIGEYPIRKLMDAGVRVTVNTDNMTVSGTTLRNEMKIISDAFSLTADEQKMIELNAAEASFAAPETKAWMKGRIEAAFF